MNTRNRSQRETARTI